MIQEKSRLTSKYQATVPKSVRTALRMKPGQKLQWHVWRGMVFVEPEKTMESAARFLTTQTIGNSKPDVLKLVRSVRGEFV